jgi:DNA ligase-1
MKKLLADGAETLKAVYSELPSWNLIIPALVKVGPEGLKDECKLTAGSSFPSASVLSFLIRPPPT